MKKNQLPLLCILVTSAMVSCSLGGGKKEGRKPLEEILARHLGSNSGAGVSAEGDGTDAEEPQMSKK